MTIIYQRAIPLGQIGNHATTDRATALEWKAAGHAVTPDPDAPNTLIPVGSVISAGAILALGRRSNMTDDEALRFGREIESLVLRAVAGAHVASVVPGRLANRLEWVNDEAHFGTPVGTKLYAIGGAQ